MHDRGLLGLGAGRAEDVQDTVDDEQRHLVVVAAGVVGRLARAAAGHHHVAEQERRVARLGIIAVGAGRPASAHRPAITGSSMGNASTSVGPSASMKRPFSSAMDSSSTNSSDSSASPSTPSATQHLASQGDPAVDVDGRRALLVGPEHLDLTLGPLAQGPRCGADVGVVARVRRPRWRGVGRRAHLPSPATSLASARS